MEKPTSARIRPFVRSEWDGLRQDLHAAGMKIKDKDDIPNALILAARRFPIEVVMALMTTYWKQEAAEEGIAP